MLIVIYILLNPKQRELFVKMYTNLKKHLFEKTMIVIDNIILKCD